MGVFQESVWNFPVLFINLLEDYGWYLLILTFIGIYIYNKCQPKIDEYFKFQADQEYSAQLHKNPDIFADRVVAQQSIADKLQKKYSEDAIKYQQKMEEKETRKREEWLAKHSDSTSGQKLGSKDNTQRSLKPDYNPLMGDNSRSYKAQRKTPCSGGGCGKK